VHGFRITACGVKDTTQVCHKIFFSWAMWWHIGW
jgi:hypothetical protein